MQHFKRFVFLLSFISIGIFSTAQDSDSLGLPGDQLDLFAVLNTFENSKDLADFEKKINDEQNAITNLDFNGDGIVDYIRVIDHQEGTSHAIVLQIPLGDSEAQDVAVIEIEKTGNETATLQIVGDRDLYGSNYIVDTDEADEKTKSFNRIIVNVWLWPSVRFIYGPTYVVMFLLGNGALILIIGNLGNRFTTTFTIHIVSFTTVVITEQLFTEHAAHTRFMDQKE